MSELELAPERRAFLEHLAPHVRFDIPSELHGDAYRSHLDLVLREFVHWADLRNHPTSVHLNTESERDGSIHLVWVDGELIPHAKLLWHDGRHRYVSGGEWKGVAFREPEHHGVLVADNIYRLGDAFEQFLRERRIPFRRYGMDRKNHLSVLQTEFRPAA